MTLPAERGSLFDRDGNDLAMSVPQHTVWADPRLVTNPQAEAAALAPVLGIDQNTLLRAAHDAGQAVRVPRPAKSTTRPRRR